MRDQGVIGDDLAGIVCEHGYNFIFYLCKMHLLFMYGDAAAVKVDDQSACPENVGGAVCCIDTCQMADGGADAGEQFGCAKGLCDVVICTEIQSKYLFIF